jgi:iron-sulfur cluster assembly accessory protein
LLENIGGINIYIDQMSAIQLEGTTIDFVATPVGAAFKFINPASTQCSCGKSFS